MNNSSVTHDINHRYFMFSLTALEQTKEVEVKMGNKNYKPGQVFVSGVGKTFTKIVRDPSAYYSQYPDAKVVISGDIRKIRYTYPE